MKYRPRLSRFFALPFPNPFPFLILVLAFSFTTVQAQTTWQVPGDAATIQAAVDAAATGDEIVLTEDLYTGDGNRDVDFMGKAITIRSQSGIPENCIIDCEGTWGDSHRGFVFTSGEGAGSRLEGVTVRGGREGSGGAIYILESSPWISDCRFENNVATGYGGGIYCASGSPEITNCVFYANLSDCGGGMTCTNYSGGSHSAPVLTGCMFLENTADFGGGFAARSYSTPTLEYCTFAGNAGHGGGLGADNGILTLRYCTLNGNIGGPLFGGAGIMGNFLPGTTLENTLICNSTNGEAIAHWDEDFITLTCCNIYGNEDGDWVGVIADQYPGSGNLSEDPQFCSGIPNEDMSWGLQMDSPCAENQSPCGQIGAWGVECGSVGTDAMVWGGVKALYR